MIKILDTLLELKDVVKVSDADIIKATKSKINDLNNPNFRKLTIAWEKVDPDDRSKSESIYFELAGMLDKEKIR